MEGLDICGKEACSQVRVRISYRTEASKNVLLTFNNSTFDYGFINFI